MKIHLLRTISASFALLAALSAGPVEAGPIDPATDPNIDVPVRAFLKKLNAGSDKPIEQLKPAEARQVLAGAQKSVKVDLSGVETKEKSIEVDGAAVKLTVVRPVGATGELPAFMFFHGGGWVLGDFPTHERFVRDLVAGSGAVAVFVNYTPSPEAHYPIAINQAYAATKWVAEHGKEIGVDGKRLAVAGNSAGGNMAAVVAIMAKEKQGPEIKLQLLFWPVTDATFETASYNQFATDRFLTKKMMMWFWDNYTTDANTRKDIHASPAQATVEQLKGLPPAFVMTAENDVLRDEGEAYARKLGEAGVVVSAVRYDGLIHDFGLLNALSDVPGTKAAMRQASAELKKALQ